MTTQTPTLACGKLPDVHVWMSVTEAALALDTSFDTVNLRVREGDLESRLNDQGIQQVLVCLPKKPAPAGAKNAWIDSLILAQFTSGKTSMPFPGMKNARYGIPEEPPARSSRFAWATAAVMLLLAGTAGVIATSAITRSREASRDLSRKLEMVSLAASDLSSQRDQLRAQLSDANVTLERVQAELVVDRNVEDTLFKAVQTAHAGKPSDSNSVFADSGH